MNNFKFQYLHLVNSPSTDQTYMSMVQPWIFSQFLKTNFYFVEWGCHWYNACQWHPCYDMWPVLKITVVISHLILAPTTQDHSLQGAPLMPLYMHTYTLKIYCCWKNKNYFLFNLEHRFTSTCIVSIFISMLQTGASAAINMHVIKRNLVHRQKNVILLRAVRYFAPLLLYQCTGIGRINHFKGAFIEKN